MLAREIPPVSFTASFHFEQNSMAHSFPLSLRLHTACVTPDTAETGTRAPNVLAFVHVGELAGLCVFDES